MDKLIIRGGRKLQGDVETSGAKNSALPLLFSTLLAEGEHVFHNVPELNDIHSTALLLEQLGCQVNRKGKTLFIKTGKPKSLEAHYDIVRKMRASILCLGPLLAKHGSAQVSLPGGCAIGTRPIDLHLKAMEALGASVEVHQGYVHSQAKKLIGGRISFPMVTVGGTENALMAASLAEGETIIENAAREPEIEDLADYLRKMGAKITGDGSSVIKVQGVSKLKPAEHEVVADRIEAGTLLIAGAISGGEVTVKKCRPEHLQALTNKLVESGFKISLEKTAITISSPPSWRGVDISTEPFPGYATDLQAQFMALMTVADGISVVTENIFENRFMHVQELVRLNADISIRSNVAIVKGHAGILEGAPVMATDLRASASLVLAGLNARGETIVNRIYHLDRGYESLEEKLSGLGASVVRSGGSS